MTKARGSGVLGKPIDPNTEPTPRDTAEAFDHGAEERGDRGYVEEPATGVTDTDGRPVDLGTSAEE